MIFTRIPNYSINLNQQKNPIKNPLIHWEYNRDKKRVRDLFEITLIDRGLS